MINIHPTIDQSSDIPTMKLPCGWRKEKKEGLLVWSNDVFTTNDPFVQTEKNDVLCSSLH